MDGRHGVRVANAHARVDSHARRTCATTTPTSAERNRRSTHQAPSLRGVGGESSALACDVARRPRAYVSRAMARGAMRMRHARNPRRVRCGAAVRVVSKAPLAQVETSHHSLDGNPSACSARVVESNAARNATGNLSRDAHGSAHRRRRGGSCATRSGVAQAHEVRARRAMVGSVRAHVGSHSGEVGHAARSRAYRVRVVMDSVRRAARRVESRDAGCDGARCSGAEPNAKPERTGRELPREVRDERNRTRRTHRAASGFAIGRVSRSAQGHHECSFLVQEIARVSEVRTEARERRETSLARPHRTIGRAERVRGTLRGLDTPRATAGGIAVPRRKLTAVGAARYH